MTTSTAVPVNGDGADATPVETRPRVRFPMSPASARPGPTSDTSDTGRPARVEGLDGLRAIAIAAVLVFHLDPAWLPGGFLGVDVFFVVSGFLITTLLVGEHERTGHIGLRAFWLRRARRLLPALVVTVVASVLIARLVSGELLVHIGRQIAGALTFSTNWVEIAAGSSYFDQTAPQLLMNFWSLAVEEQFYLVWPLATVLLVRFAGPRSRVVVALSLAAGSALLMAAWWAPEGATRVYYGTDTHLMGLMLGAALAFGWVNPVLRARLTPSTWGPVGAWAVPSAALALGAGLWLLDETDAMTFRIGILAASVATVVLVLGVLDPAPSLWQRTTRHPAATWLGVRSYAVYLWHWPVVLFVARDNPSAPGTLSHLLTRIWCLVVTLALADLTYRFVETPFRRHGFRGVARTVLDALLRSSRRARQVTSATIATGLIVLAVIVLTAPDRSETAAMLEANEAAAAARMTTTPAATATRTPVKATGATTGVPTRPAPVASPRPPKAVAPAVGGFTMPKGSEIDAYGDSMMVGSLHALDYYFPGIRIDARSNRRWSDGLRAIRMRGDAGRRAVVLAFGTNAGVDQHDVEAIITRLGPRRMVVLVNLMAPFARIDSDNQALDFIASRHPNVIVADWAGAVREHPEQLQADRIHPSLRGSHLFAKTVRQALATLSERHTGKKVALKDLPVP